MSFRTLHCFECTVVKKNNNDNSFVYIYIFSGHNNVNYGSPCGTLLNNNISLKIEIEFYNSV